MAKYQVPFLPSRLPYLSCRCHQATIKWCSRHGEPLRFENGRLPQTEAQVRLLEGLRKIYS